MAQAVYLVERPDLSNLPTTLEALVVGVCIYFALHHHVHALLAGYGGLMAAGVYVGMHTWKSTFWLVALSGMATWGTLGYGIASSIWPHDWVWKIAFAFLGGAISLGEKTSLYMDAHGIRVEG